MPAALASRLVVARGSLRFAAFTASLLVAAACSCGEEEGGGGGGGGSGGAGGEPGCTADADCGAGRRCADGVCIGCASRADCAAPTPLCDLTTQRCVACLSGGDCASPDVCRDGACGHACDGDAECQAPSVCDLPGVSPSGPSYTCIERPAVECVADGDCAANAFCEQGRCRCENDLGCAVDEICDGGSCIPLPTCEGDADCTPYGRVCESLLGDARCVPACAADADCGAGGALACDGGHCRQRCTGDVTCLDPATVCDGGLCVPAECDTLADCPAGSLCTGRTHGRCAPYVGCTGDADCADPDLRCGDPSPCPPGFDCGAVDICLEREPCVSDADCTADEFCQGLRCRPSAPCQVRADCPADQDCVASLCVPFVCRGPADCTAPEVCVAGACQAPAAADAVTEVRILTVPRPLLAGEMLVLVAVALTASGQAVPGQVFEWASTEPAVVQVDAAGLLTALGAGASDVTASLATGPGRRVTSQPATFHVLAPVTAGDVRVVVFDRGSGLPLAGATVVLDGAEGSTGADGVAPFPGASAASHDVASYAPGFERVIVLGARSDDVAVAAAADLTGRAAGFTSTISFAQVTSQGGLEVGLAGASRESLLALGPSALLGEIFTTTVTTPLGVYAVPAPGAMTLELTSPFPVNVKDTAYATGDPGLRSLWSFAGRLDPMLLGVGGGGGVPSAGQLIGRVLPWFGTFEHGIDAAETLVDVPTVPDAADLDGDGDTAERLPDYLGPAFPAKSLRPTTAQNLRVEVALPGLPSFGGSRLDTVVLLAAAQVPRLGATPLGISSTTDEDGDGAVDPVRMSLAPLHGGLEAGAYAAAAMAIRLPAPGETRFPAEVSLRTARAATLPALVELSAAPFLPFLEGSSWDGTRRAVVHDPVELAAARDAGAELVRVVVDGLDGRLVVYQDVSLGEAIVPAPPAAWAGLDPAAPGETAEVRVEPISVAGPTWDDLTSSGGATLADLDPLADGASRAIARPAGP